MLSDWIDWWLRQMSELLERGPWQAGRTRADGLLVMVEPPLPDNQAKFVELRRRRRGVVTPLGRFALDGAGMAAIRAATAGRPVAEMVGLVAPADMVLSRDVLLPLAAEREAENVLRYEMERLTPFAADELFWTWTRGFRDRARGQVRLRLALLPKAQLQPLLVALDAAGLRPAVLRPSAAAEWTSIPLIRPDARQRARWQLTRRIGVAVPGLLAASIVLTPILRQSASLAAAEARIASLRPMMAEADALRRGITADLAGVDAIVSARAHAGDALSVMRALTESLPDDTYLTGLTLSGDRLAMEGRSAAATKLIGALSAVPIIRNPAFAAPVTRGENQKEVFSIQAEFGS